MFTNPHQSLSWCLHYKIVMTYHKKQNDWGYAWKECIEKDSPPRMYLQFVKMPSFWGFNSRRSIWNFFIKLCQYIYIYMELHFIFYIDMKMWFHKLWFLRKLQIKMWPPLLEYFHYMYVALVTTWIHNYHTNLL